MSLPVSATRAHAPSAGAVQAPFVLVHVRVMGQPDAVVQVARQLRDVLHVAEESTDYPRRMDLGVRRYLTVLHPADERHPRTGDDGVRTQ